MIQDKPTFWNTIFLTKVVMKCYTISLSNEQPIVFPQLMYIIPTVFGTSSWTMLSSYKIVIFSIENTFNNYWKFSTGLLILLAIWSIITKKLNHCMSSIIFLAVIICYWENQFLTYFTDFSLEFNFFSYAAVSRLILRSSINAWWSISFA